MVILVQASCVDFGLTCSQFTTLHELMWKASKHLIYLTGFQGFVYLLLGSFIFKFPSMHPQYLPWRGFWSDAAYFLNLCGAVMYRLDVMVGV
jgi:hypothetical protein